MRLLAIEQRGNPLAYRPSDKFAVYLIKHGYVTHDLFIPDLNMLISEVENTPQADGKDLAKMVGIPVIDLTDKGQDYLDKHRKLFVKRGLIQVRIS